MSQKTTALTFDASTVAPQAAIEILPPGWYVAEIADAEVKATKGRNAGKAAAFEFSILTPEFKGRKVFANINVQNASAQAQEIGQRELSAICHAVGIMNVSDLQVFIGKQLQVKVKTRKATDAEKEKGYEDRSEPAGYKALEGAPVGAAPGYAPAAPPAIGGPPAPPAPPAAPPAPPAAFPPAGWQANPNAPGWFWNAATGEQKQEAELRALAAPAAPPAPAPAPPAPPAPAPAPAPPAAPTPPPAPAPAPVAEFPPAGWVAHPSAPGWFYNAANPTDMKDEATLRASVPAAPPAAPAGPPAPPAVPAAGSPPPWKQG